MRRYFSRKCPVQQELQSKSVLLLGPRRIGKSKFIEEEIKPSQIYNLLHADTFRILSSKPETIRQNLPTGGIVAIDEIQKLPSLMDEVHSMIEASNVRFLITGSSAKKLKRNFTSLMAGRARRLEMLPLTSQELGDSMDLEKILQIGSIPSIYLSPTPFDDLKDYVGMYLREEVAEEAFVRKIENFSRFLEVAAISNGQLLNFEEIANDAQVPSRTIREYYQLLEDTLIGRSLSPIRSTKKRKSISTAKFYFFDIGVVNALVGREKIYPKSTEFGFLFEHWVYQEIKAYLEYTRANVSFGFWRSPRKHEVDFILNEKIAIEVKATERANENHISGLLEFDRQEAAEKLFLVSRDLVPRRIGKIEILPWKIFVKKLWDGDLI